MLGKSWIGSLFIVDRKSVVFRRLRKRGEGEVKYHRVGNVWIVALILCVMLAASIFHLFSPSYLTLILAITAMVLSVTGIGKFTRDDATNDITGNPKESYLLFGIYVISIGILGTRALLDIRAVASSALLFLSAVLSPPESLAQEIRFKGYIDKAAVDKIELELNSGSYERLVITSEGGLQSEAVRMGQLIQSAQLKVEAKDYCLSACAAVVLAAGSSSEIAKDTVVAFHLSAASILLGVEGATFGSDDVDATLLDGAAELHQFYTDQNIDRAIFRHALYAHDVRCLKRDPSQPFGYAAEVGKELWIPSKDYLLNLGFPLVGFWPYSPKEAEKLLQSKGLGSLSYFIGADYRKLSELSSSRVIRACGS